MNPRRPTPAGLEPAPLDLARAPPRSEGVVKVLLYGLGSSRRALYTYFAVSGYLGVRV